MVRYFPKMRTILGILTGFSITVMSTLFFWKDCAYNCAKSPRSVILDASTTCHFNNASFQKIPCVINGNRRKPVECRLEEPDEVFVPFSFVAKYFDISGKIEVDRKSPHGERYLNWQHSYAKLISPKLPYQTDGIFMAFDNYNVEVRDRVKCISAIEGIPVSSQWSSSGHIYPIQVAQFGLSHYSKNISEEPPRQRIIADFGTDVDVTVSADCFSERLELEDETMVLNFSAPVSLSSPGISIPFPDVSEPYFTFPVKFFTSGSISIHLEVQEKQRSTYELVYTTTSDVLVVENNRIIYGIGPASEWNLLVRDIYIDLVKGLNLNYKKSSKKDKFRPNIARMRIRSAELRGSGYLGTLMMRSSAHSELFEKSADWLIRNQDKEGGWPVMVNRKLGTAELKAPWYSAMAQGQAMSTLARAFKRTKKRKFIDSAVRGLQLFTKSSELGGITAVFLDRFTWYEEYPTNPSSFVLNGFIYALVGLYDVKMTASGVDAKKAGDLFEEGVVSLIGLLPLFDTGSGSIYDLRHFTLKGPPNLARWDYHATHITQLLVMNSINPDPVFGKFAERWAEYMRGHRADHN